MTPGALHPVALAIEGAIIGFLIALPVGPAAILCIRRTIAAGAFAGYATGLGAALGDVVFGAVAVFGLSFVAEFISRYEFWIRAFGGVFLCAMGVSYLRHRPRSVGDPVALDRERRLATYVRYCSSSFFITVFNPITVMAFAAVFAGRGLSDVGSDATEATILIAAVFAGALAWWLLLCMVALVLRRRFSEAGLVWLNRVSGGALLLFGIAAFVSLLPIDWRGLLERLSG